MTSPWVLRWLAAVSVVALVGLGCNQNSAQPIVWPSQLTVGERAAIPIAANRAAGFGSTAYRYDLDLSNVTIEIDDDAGTTEAEIVAVFDGFSARSISVTSESIFGWPWTTIVVFDTDDVIVNSFPFTTKARVFVDGQPLVNPAAPSGVVEGDLTFAGPCCAPVTFFPFPGSYASPPALRLRAVEDSANYFDPGWSIGSIEFDLTFPSVLADPEAFTRGEAGAAAVILEPDNGTQTRHVVVVDPSSGGFQFSNPDGSPGPLLGGGPFIDIAFRAKTGAFDSAGFSIANLSIRDPDGLEQRAATDGTAFFEFTTLNDD